jgi:hypothetical protein
LQRYKHARKFAKIENRHPLSLHKLGNLSHSRWRVEGHGQPVFLMLFSPIDSDSDSDSSLFNVDDRLRLRLMDSDSDSDSSLFNVSLFGSVKSAGDGQQ